MIAAAASPAVLAIVPGWILATAVASGRLPGRQRAVWGAWLLLGYLLVPASVLLSPVFAGLGIAWLVLAVAGLGWNLWRGSGEPAAPPLPDQPAENLLEPLRR